MKKRIFTLAILLLTFASIAFSNYFPDVILTSPNGTWLDTRVYANIDNAVAAALATGEHRDLYIVRQEITTALTLHPALTVKFFGSGSIANSGQLTINTTNIIADNRQVFTGAGDIDWIAGSVAKTSWFVDLDWALEVTNDDTMVLKVTQAETTDDDMAVGDDVTLKWDSPFIITVDAGDTLSNVKNIEAGNYQILAGAGDVDFLDGTRFKLDWVNRLRTILTWVETEDVTIVVSGSNQVTFTDTASANEYFDFTSEHGSFSRDGGVTLTFNSPGHLNSPRHQIFTGAGDTAFTTSTGDIDPWWWGASPYAAAAVNDAAFADSIATLQSSGSYRLRSGDYDTSNVITFTSLSGTVITFDGRIQTDGTHSGFTFDAIDTSEIRIRRVLGPAIDFTGGYWGVKFSGATSSTGRNKVNIGAISQFQFGLYMDPDGNGLHYSEFHINSLFNFKYGIYIDATTGSTNDNTYFLGRVSLSDAAKTAADLAAVDTYGVYYEATPAFTYTNQRFYNGTFENLNNGFRLHTIDYILLVNLRFEAVAAAAGEYILDVDGGLGHLVWIMGTGNIDASLLNFAEGTVRNVSIIGAGTEDSDFKTFITDNNYGGMSWFTEDNMEQSHAELTATHVTGLTYTDHQSIASVLNKSYTGATIPTSGSYRENALVWNTDTSAGENAYWRVTANGTMDTNPAGMTATTTAASTTVTVTVGTIANLLPGQYVEIVGETWVVFGSYAQINSIDYVGLTFETTTDAVTGVALPAILTYHDATWNASVGESLRGTGSIATGTTSDVITHNAGWTPSTGEVFITLGEDPTNTPGAIWVDTFTTTQFTVHSENNPGASNLDFGWRIIGGD